MGDLISKKTRCEFREYFVGKTLREIQTEFDNADVPFDESHVPNLSGQRRSLVEQYYHAVDFSKWADVRKVLKVYEIVLAELEVSAQGDGYGVDEAKAQFRTLQKWIERDGFSYKDGRLDAVGRAAHLPEIQDAAVPLDAPELHRQIDRMRHAVDDDPRLAIGTAKELIETTCKTILTERNEVVEKKWELSRLVKETRKTLNLLPEDVPETARGAKAIHRLLGGLSTVAQGLGEIRNLYGTGHGPDGRAKGLSGRHARLAVGSAAALCTFLLETHEDRD